MEKDTLIILDLRRFEGITKEYTIALECFYPADIEDKKKGMLVERIVTIGRYIDIEQAKGVGREMWGDYSKDAMKELWIVSDMVKEFKFDNFKDFGL